MKHSSVWKHLFSLIYDIFPIAGLFLTTSLLIMLIRSGEVVPTGTIWFQILLAAEVFFYFAYSWKSGGQTLGMRAWKLVIVEHKTLTWSKVSLRFIAGCLSILTLGFGLWIKAFNKSKLTWMDQVSHTETLSITKS